VSTLELPRLGNIKRTWTRHDDARGMHPIYRIEYAILLYRHNAGWGSDGDDVYATIHNIERNRREGPHLAAGTPATVEGCTEFAKALADRSAFSGFMSPNMLYVGPRVAAWWRPSVPARVWFKTAPGPERNRDHLSIGTRSAITPHPGLVFMISDAGWHVFAVAGTERPGPATALYRSPYFNVYADGLLCEGNIERPKKVTPETIAGFERAFFDSRFTHPNAKHLVRFKGGAAAFWKAMLAGKWKDFPERCLLPLKTTLLDKLREMEGGARARR
jgi:PRTRC genetic system protein B